MDLLAHQVVDGGKLQGRVALEGFFEEPLGHGGGTLEQSAEIEPHQGSRQQARRREDREAAADVVWNRQDLLVGIALGLEQLTQRARRPGHGEEQMLPPLRARAIILDRIATQHAQGGGRLQRRARLAYGQHRPALLAPLRIDTGALDQVEEFLEGIVIDVVTVKIDLRDAEARLGWQLVWIAALDG